MTNFTPEFADAFDDKNKAQSKLKRNTIYQYHTILIELLFVFKSFTKKKQYITTINKNYT